MLVPYPDSESDDDQPAENRSVVDVHERSPDEEHTLQQEKKYDNDPRDDPDQHQGRKRSRPFTLGDYNMHVFASVTVPSNLRDTLLAITDKARSLTGFNVHCFLETDPSLHVSLTHPHPLRRSQIAQTRAELSSTVARHPPFHLGFAGRVSAYVNGKKYGGEGQGGRAFLAVRLSAGADAVERIVKDIHPILDKLHLQRYHDNPEYHASFAWCLADGEEHTPFTAAVLEELSAEYESALMKHQPKAGWKVDRLDIKVGKEVYRMPLRGARGGGS